MLTWLNLYDNGIGDVGASALATALQTNTTLTSLILAGNVIGALGATALATALQTNTMLSSLDLAWNPISALGTTALATALQTNTTLTSLNMRYNGICAAPAVTLLSAHPSCVVLLDPNHFDGKHDCCAQLLQAGASWDLRNKNLSARDLDWLAFALGDPRV
jgi:Ran GTPase-activating protein (RanGAP) involved in mRNA processing and transport